MFPETEITPLLQIIYQKNTKIDKKCSLKQRSLRSCKSTSKILKKSLKQRNTPLLQINQQNTKKSLKVVVILTLCNSGNLRLFLAYQEAPSILVYPIEQKYEQHEKKKKNNLRIVLHLQARQVLLDPRVSPVTLALPWNPGHRHHPKACVGVT